MGNNNVASTDASLSADYSRILKYSTIFYVLWMAVLIHEKVFSVMEKMERVQPN